MARTAQGERVRDILDAAMEEFARQGFHAARMHAIAEGAGVADGTVYLYFRNKADILLAVFRENIGHFLHRLDEERAGALDGKDELCRLVHFHLSYLEARPHLARVAQLELRQPDPDIRQGVSDILSPYFSRIDAAIARGQREGHLRRETDARTMRRLVFGALDECVSAWVTARHPYALSAVADDLSRLLLGGMKA